MQEYTIITDSCCDFSREIVEKLGVKVLPLRFRIDGKEYRHFYDFREMDLKTFYGLMREGKVGKTAAANLVEINDMFEAELKQGRDVLYIGFSSGLSSHFQSVRMAAAGLEQNYPGQRVALVDTLSASAGMSLLVYQAVLQKNQGKTLDEVYTYLNDNIQHVGHTFIADDLNYLKESGRVSGAKAFIGGVLNFKPVMYATPEGQVIIERKVRGRKAAMQAMLDKVKNTCTNPEIFFVGHGDCEADADTVIAGLKKLYPDAKIFKCCVGPVIGCHGGPNTMVITYWADHR